jgi:hypothetical protein
VPKSDTETQGASNINVHVEECAYAWTIKTCGMTSLAQPTVHHAMNYDCLHTSKQAKRTERKIDFERAPSNASDGGDQNEKTRIPKTNLAKTPLWTLWDIY